MAAYNAYVIRRKSDGYYWHGIKNDTPNCWTPDLIDAEICRKKPRVRLMKCKAVPVTVTIEEINNG
jgi:hypothetical protein